MNATEILYVCASSTEHADRPMRISVSSKPSQAQPVPGEQDRNVWQNLFAKY